MINWIFDLDLTLYELNGRVFSYQNIRKSPNLRNNIAILPGRKILFTNGNLQHSIACVNILGLKKLFHKVLCRELTGFKPSINSYIKTYHYTGMKQGDTTIFFEDTVINLEMAKKFNWITVLIKRNATLREINNSRVDFHFKDIESALKYFGGKKFLSK